jgi:hypothetical protein
VAAQVFTHPPTHPTFVSGIVPLGSANPGGRHVLPVDHMYMLYPHPDTEGFYRYPVYAMGRGEIVMLTRTRMAESPSGYDYSIFIRHVDAPITSYYIHLHKLEAVLESYFAAREDKWLTVRPGFQVMLLGQLGAPPVYWLPAGRYVGDTASFSHAWDIGVIDPRVTGSFLGRGSRRYPTIPDYLSALGYAASPPYPGQETLHARCFIDYMTPALRAEWQPLLVSAGRSCGRVGWDVANTIQGSWFNGGVDVVADGIWRIEEAAFAIVPWHLNPSTHVQIAIASGGGLAKLDPADAYPQLDQEFVIRIDRTPGTSINPDPLRVGPGAGTVCYDLEYLNADGTRFNTLKIRLTAERTVAMRFDPTPRATPGCTHAPWELPDGAWVSYIR